MNGEANRKREADLDRQREQVRKKQAEAFEKRVQQLEEERRNNPSQSERERERRLEEINARAARLGLQPRGQATGQSSRNGRPEYNPLMGGKNSLSSFPLSVVLSQSKTNFHFISPLRSSFMKATSLASERREGVHREEVGEVKLEFGCLDSFLKIS